MKKKNLFYFSLVLVFIFSIQSCSRLDLVVNLANSYLTNKADDYFDLTKDQKRWVSDALEKNIAKVKKTILPQLAAEMFKAADVVSSKRPIDGIVTYSAYERLENLMFQGLRIFTDDVVAFTNKLTPKQVDYFQNKFDKKVAELRDDPSKKSYDKIKKQFDSWMGSVTSAQKASLKKFVEKNPPPTSETIFNRQLLAHGFIKAYPDPVARKKYVEKLLINYDSMIDKDYAKIINEKNKKVSDFVTSILNTMSDGQRSVLVETLRDRANQLIKISKG
jgi:hypothetical protein